MERRIRRHGTGWENIPGRPGDANGTWDGRHAHSSFLVSSAVEESNLWILCSLQGVLSAAIRRRRRAAAILGCISLHISAWGIFRADRDGRAFRRGKYTSLTLVWLGELLLMFKGSSFWIRRSRAVIGWACMVCETAPSTLFNTWQRLTSKCYSELCNWRRALRLS